MTLSGVLKAAAQTVLTAASAVYPFLWYYGRGKGWFDWLAGGMLVLWLLRGVMQKTCGQKAVSFAVAVFFALVLAFRQPESMYWYPVCISLLMLGLFGGSLFTRQSLIERLARLQKPELPPEAVAYTRRVTQIWCGFFVLNGSAAALLAASGNADWWALYTGVISYILMGALGGSEWLYRRFVLKV